MNIFGDNETFLSIIANYEDTGEAEEMVGNKNDDSEPILFGDSASFQYICAEQELETENTFENCAEVGSVAQELLQTINELAIIDSDTNESELQFGNLEFVEAVYYDSDVDGVFENLNQAFACVATDCGKIRVGNDYGAFEIDRKCGAPYARFCPCPPEKNTQCGCDSKPKNNINNKISAGLTDLTDLFSWYWTARENANCNPSGTPCNNFGNFKQGNCDDGGCLNNCPHNNCYNNMNVGHCPKDNFFNNNCNRCDNPEKWTPQNNCKPPEKTLRPCSKRLSRNIYYKLLQTTQAVAYLADCAPNECARQTLCTVKQNLDTLSLAMLATSKQICGARPISMNALDNFNCPFEKGVYAVICELSAILKDIQLLQTLPATQPVYGALAIISFGTNRVISMLHTL